MDRKNRKPKDEILKKYYGKRGNEIVKIEEFEDVVQVHIIHFEDEERTIAAKRFCSLPRPGVEIKIDDARLTLRADIREIVKTPKGERPDVIVGIREVVLWDKPEEVFDLTDEEQADDYRDVCEIKETVEIIEKLPEDALYEMDITVISDGAYSRFNSMRSMEDGYETIKFRRIDDDSEDANPIRKLNAKYLGTMTSSDEWDFDLKEVGAEYMTLLRELVDADDMGDISIDDIKIAMMFAFDRRRGYDPRREAERRDLINAIRNLLDKKETPRETKVLWARGLFEALDKDEVRDYVKDLTLKQFNYVYYQAMKEDVRKTPSSRLMNWYKEGLEKNIGYMQEEEMYNRLAYFHLQHYASIENMRRAKAYFLAMERRGIQRENPYEDFCGGDSHSELINVLLNDEHAEDIDLYVEEYFKRMKAKTVD